MIRTATRGAWSTSSKGAEKETQIRLEVPNWHLKLVILFISPFREFSKRRTLLKGRYLRAASRTSRNELSNALFFFTAELPDVFQLMFDTKVRAFWRRYEKPWGKRLAFPLGCCLTVLW